MAVVLFLPWSDGPLCPTSGSRRGSIFTFRKWLQARRVLPFLLSLPIVLFRAVAVGAWVPGR